MPSKMFLALAAAVLFGAAMISTSAYAVDPNTTEASDVKTDQKDNSKDHKDIRPANHDQQQDDHQGGGAFTK
jgi:hypothetical protein